MTRNEKKEELIGLFATGTLFIDEVIDEAIDFADWISVEDERPPLGGYFLYFGKIGEARIMNCNTVHHGRSNEEYLQDCIERGVITHWMPLPNPPKKGDEQ